MQNLNQLEFLLSLHWTTSGVGSVVSVACLIKWRLDGGGLRGVTLQVT